MKRESIGWIDATVYGCLSGPHPSPPPLVPSFHQYFLSYTSTYAHLHVTRFTFRPEKKIVPPCYIIYLSSMSIETCIRFSIPFPDRASHKKKDEKRQPSVEVDKHAYLTRAARAGISGHFWVDSQVVNKFYITAVKLQKNGKKRKNCK